MKYILVAAVAVIIGVAILLFSLPSTDNGTGCSVDSECVPAECCHSTSCVSLSEAPDCSDVFCTMECKPGTMDCGAGICVCENSKCNVEWA